MSTLEQAIAVAQSLSPEERERLIEAIRAPEREIDLARRRAILSIRGKYADLPNSSEDFIRRKHEELDAER